MSSTTLSISGTVHISQSTPDSIYYNNGYFSGIISLDDGLLLKNSDPTNLLSVLFDTDITITNTWHIICGSKNIQFGSTSLKDNGTRPVITINVTDYPGFIQNGNYGTNGNNNIFVFNLEVNATGTSILANTNNSGWIGQQYFGKSAANNYIVNCSSNGPINAGGGGIVGSGAGSGSGASLKIIGCSSLGDGPVFLGGGIAGANAGANGGSITCEYCWSTGLIGQSAGGIFGAMTLGSTGGTTIANYCYSMGLISRNAGGIFGGRDGVDGTCNATNCYSRGNIGTDAGGIFGSSAGGTCNATNCYSSGTVDSTDRGIYGKNTAPGAATNCYIANGSWTDNAAYAALQSGSSPSSSPGAGSIWVSSTANSPYELKNMGYTPYSIVNITTSPTPALKKTYSQTIQSGQSSTPGIVQGANYTIISGGHPTMSINSTTGAITSTNATPRESYNCVVQNTGSYNITTFTLCIVGFVPGPPPWSRAGGNNCPNCDSNYGTSACGNAIKPYSTHALDERRKVEILKYRSNSSQLSKAQQYSMLSRNALTRKKSWATQTQTYTNPNVNNLPERESEGVPVALECNNPPVFYSLTSDCDVPGPVIPLYIDAKIPLYNYKMQVTPSSGGKQVQ